MIPTKVEKKFDQMEAARQTLLQSLAAYTTEQLNQQPQTEAWSALQTIHHLMLAEAASLQYIQKKLSYNPELSKKDFASAWRSGLLRIYLKLPFKFKAPKMVAENLPNDWTLAQVMARWDDLRNETKTFLSGLDAGVWDKQVYKHPLAGRVTLEGMLDFFQTHFERHCGQIERTLKTIS